MEDTDRDDDVRLAECGVVAVEVKYVRDDEEGWAPVVRRKRKKCAGCVGDGELRVDRGSVISFRNLNGVLAISICDGGFSHWVAVKPSLVSSRTRTKCKQ